MTITYAQRRELAEKVRTATFVWLVGHTDIASDTALRAATDAANEHGRILKLALEERGVAVEDQR